MTRTARVFFSWMSSMPLVLVSISLAGCTIKLGEPSTTPSEERKTTKWDVNCTDFPLAQGNTARACVRKANADGERPSVIYYYLHGLGGSPTEIFKGTAADLFDELPFGDGNYAMIGLSVGSSQLIAAHPDGTALPGAREISVSVMDEVERRLGYEPGSAPKRHLIGASMGAMSALNLAFDGGSSSYRSVSALCPALIDFSPFDADAEHAYAARHAPALKPGLLHYALGILREKFPSPEIWQANDPIALAKTTATNALPFFLSAGSEDEFGFAEGAQAFAAAKGGQAFWAPASGTHCSFDREQLLSFLRGLEQPR